MRIKKRSLTLLLLLIFINTFLLAQSAKIPPFAVIQSNGKVFKAKDLPVGKPVLIIYFSPECDYCIKLINEFMKKQSSFKNVSVAMITYLPIANVSKFVRQYDLDRYSNIYVGTEGNSFFVRNYFRILEMPFLALYTKTGSLIKLYPKPDSLNDLIRQLNNINGGAVLRK